MAAPPAPREALRARLLRLSGTDAFLFGQQNATLWGMYLDGRLVPTSAWYEASARAGRWTSDAAALTGDDPAVLGLTIEMLAFEPPAWNRRAVVAAAARRQIERGGVVTLDWHTPSCVAPADGAGDERLGTVVVDGRDVPIRILRGGMHFYAEEAYERSITAAAAVPESLTCLCKVANDLPLASGAYEGLSGRAWLVALAKHTAAVLRAEGLAGLPIVVRPFHEQNGSWFWWGQPYWRCDALLGRPGAISGPAAYKRLVRAYVEALRGEPGTEGLLFAHSPDQLRGASAREPLARAERKIADPSSLARDLLRARLVAELGALGLAYESPAQRAALLRLRDVTSPARERQFVDQARRLYREAYPGDDVVDLLGLDLYHPLARAARPEDLRRFGLYLRALAEEARARGKPHALTEAGTYRLHLLQLVAARAPGDPVRIAPAEAVAAAHARLFHPEDRRRLLAQLGLAAPADVLLSPRELAGLFPPKKGHTEDWYNAQLLALAKGAQVAYALVWQTYFDPRQAGRYVYHYVPYPGHPEAEAFRRFYEDPASCFLADRCGVEP